MAPEYGNEVKQRLSRWWRQGTTVLDMDLMITRCRFLNADGSNPSGD